MGSRCAAVLHASEAERCSLCANATRNRDGLSARRNQLASDWPARLPLRGIPESLASASASVMSWSILCLHISFCFSWRIRYNGARSPWSKKGQTETIFQREQWNVVSECVDQWTGPGQPRFAVIILRKSSTAISQSLDVCIRCITT